jgi:hypothetical protein
MWLLNTLGRVTSAQPWDALDTNKNRETTQHGKHFLMGDLGFEQNGRGGMASQSRAGNRSETIGKRFILIVLPAKTTSTIATPG